MSDILLKANSREAELKVLIHTQMEYLNQTDFLRFI